MKMYRPVQSFKNDVKELVKGPIEDIATIAIVALGVAVLALLLAIVAIA